ncbi:MAG TPA: lyase [Acidimicrobiia bacterium]
MTRSLLTLIVVSAAACATTTGDSFSSTATVPRATTSSVPPSATTSQRPGTTTTVAEAASDPATLEMTAFPIPSGSRPHDVAPAADGGVWYTAQASGELGWLDPATGETRHTDLGAGSAPHGVIIDDEGTPWITDGGLNAIVSVDPGSLEVTVYPLPSDAPEANLNTAAFDGGGTLWFTGQSGVYGFFDPGTGEIDVFPAPGGGGPYGITTTPDGTVYYASLAGSHIARIGDRGEATVLQPPTADQGARRVWSDSRGRIWVSEWNSGNLSRYTPGSDSWETWHLPGDDPQTYAVYVDGHDIVWASDFGSNSIMRFDPGIEEFHRFELPHDPGEVRQMLGRPGEVWAPESAADALVVIREGT